jgi:hypothetical protein
MQPYFFPYIGYFSLLKNVDRFILFDPVQFIRHGWIARNRILKQNDGWLYIRAPLMPHPHQAAIRDVRVDHRQDWRKSLLSQLVTYKRIAPHYWSVRKMVEEALAKPHESIVETNKAILETVCAYIGISTTFEVFSNMTIEIEPPTAPDEWALNICNALGDVSEYWNPPGGESFFDRSKYDAAGLTLRFQKPSLSEYDQGREPFEAGLSIIDVLMFNSPAVVSKMLDDYTLR